MVISCRDTLRLCIRLISLTSARACIRRRLKKSDEVKYLRAENCDIVQCTRDQWLAAGVSNTDLVVRAISGTEVLAQAATFETCISDLLDSVCEQTESRTDEVQLLFGTLVLDPRLCLGECLVPPGEVPLELTYVKRLGPLVTAAAKSGRSIQVLKQVPEVGGMCHSDRNYRFTSLGDFDKRPRMMYIKTSNDDKSTPARKVMWTLDVRVPVVVYLNFRSTAHIESTGASVWLERDGWRPSALRSTVSTGIPNGPYRGPVLQKRCEAGKIDLMGSNCGEGTYFVFVETEADV